MALNCPACGQQLPPQLELAARQQMEIQRTQLEAIEKLLNKSEEYALEKLARMEKKASKDGRR